MLLPSPADAWAAYQAAAASNGLLVDCVTAASINTCSDTAAQLTQRSRDPARTARFLTFGAADGAVSHVWFAALDAVVGDDGSTLLKVASDALVYTPLWCCWFLAAFTVMEGRDPRSVPGVISAEWRELFQGNLGFFLPITGLIYGLVPIEDRVLAFGSASLIYTSILSLWNSGSERQSRRQAGQPAAALELCELDGDGDDQDCVALPEPPRTASTLSFGVRRTVVRATRRVRGVMQTRN